MVIASVLHSSPAAALTAVTSVGAITAASSQSSGETSFVIGEIEHPALIETLPAITSRNADGFRLSLVRLPDDGGRVRGIFELSRRPEFLAEERGISLTPEGGTRRDTVRLDGSITWVEFPLWDGQGNAIVSDLRELMQASSVEVTYYLQGGGYKTTAFPLDGLAAAAAELYSIPERIGPEQRAAALERQALLEAAGQRCLELKRKKRSTCIEAARACEQRHEDNQAFADCLQSCCG